jgi:hypothetical protein
MAFNHAPKATLALRAARQYFSFSAGVTRISILAVAGSGMGGLPRCRLGLSMDELCTVQIILDKPLPARYSVRTVNQPETEMVRNSKQVWEVGETVKVGFLTLRITAKEATPGDYLPDAYLLTDKTGSKVYRFVPHNGLERVQ